MKYKKIYDIVYKLATNLHYIFCKYFLKKIYKHNKKLKLFINQLDKDPPKNIASKEFAIYIIYSIINDTSENTLFCNINRIIRPSRYKNYIRS